MMVTDGKKNICGVQAAAKTHFENGEIHVLLPRNIRMPWP